MCAARPCCHLTECAEASLGEAKARLGPAGLTTLLGSTYLVASTRRNHEGAAPAAPKSNERSEGGASDDVSLARCPDCLRHIATKRGLSIHRRSAHPEEYHLENVPKDRKKARWDHEEMVLLARRQINLLEAGTRRWLSFFRVGLSKPSRGSENVQPIKGC